MKNYRKPFAKNPIRNINSDGGFVSIFRTIGFIGDSLSSGEHESYSEEVGRGYHDYMEYSWGQYIARKCGLTAYNFSKGGLTAKEFFNYIQSNNPFTEEMKCQCYVIALGVNDVNHLDGYSKGFGTIEDINLEDEEKNADSYVGWYAKIIQKLRKLEPKCRIFVVTTPTEKPESETKKENFGKIQKFLNQLPSIFDFLYVVDLRKYAPIYDKKFGQKYFLAGHMSAMGYKFTADMISTYMDYIISHNIDDFKQVGFIGKGVHNTMAKW